MQRKSGNPLAKPLLPGERASQAGSSGPNPFFSSISKANIVKDKEARKKKGKKDKQNQQPSSASAAVHEQQEELRDTGKQYDPAADLVASGHVPGSSKEYLDQIMTQVDTSELLDIVQVFHHKQHRQGMARGIDMLEGGGASSGTNDFVVAVLEIKSAQLREFYGQGSFLVQIWRNKRRLFQHVHYFKIKKIFLNDTEIAYTLDIPQDILAEQRMRAESEETIEEQAEPFDAYRNFIYVVQPFTQSFARIENPFEGEQEFYAQTQEDQTVLFINDEHLIIGQNHQLKYAKVEDFLFSVGSSDKKAKKDAKKVKYYRQRNFSSGAIGNFGSINNYSLKKKEGHRMLKANKNVHHQMSSNVSAVLQEPSIAQRQKDMMNNKSLYGDSKQYQSEASEVVEIDFETCMLGLQWKILCLDYAQISTCECSDKSAGIVIYAAKKGELILQVFQLMLGKLSQQSEAAPKGEGSDDEQESRVFKEVQCWKGLKTKGDEYKHIQIVQTAENQKMAILVSKDGHVDITNHNLIQIEKSKASVRSSFGSMVHPQDFGTLSEPDRFTNKETRLRGRILQIFYGAEKLHFSCENGDKNPNCYSFSLNIQTSKVDHGSKQEAPSLVMSMLSEDFFRRHLQIYDDMKIFSGLIALVHGQVLSLYSTTLKTWSHFFNKRDITKSNDWTKYCKAPPSDDIGLKISGAAPSSDEFSPAEFMPSPMIQAEDNVLKAIPFGMSDHSHFNRKEFEMIKVEFLPQQSYNFFELLVCLQGGHVRKINAVYHKASKEDQEDTFNFGERPSHDCLITCQPLQSKCGGISKEKPYFAVSLASKANFSVYRDVGVMEKKVFIKTVEVESQEYAPDLFVNNDDNTFSRLLSYSGDTARDYVELIVQNSKNDHLFIFNKKTRFLSIYNTEASSRGADTSAFTLPVLDAERLLLRVPEFNYTPSTKYFMEENFLYYTWQGNVQEINLLTGEKLKICYGGFLLENMGCFMPGKQFIYRQRKIKDAINYSNFNYTRPYLIKNEKDFGELDVEIDKTEFSSFLAIQACPILQNQSSISHILEYDMINNEVAMFTTPTKMVTIPNLNQYERECKGTYLFDQRFIASNVDQGFMVKNSAQNSKEGQLKFKTIDEQYTLMKYTCPTDYPQQFCALDAKENIVKVWNIGTGQFIREIKEAKSFKGFKRHNTWDDSTLVWMDKETSLNQMIEEQMNEAMNSFSARSGSDSRSTTFHRSKYIMHKKVTANLKRSQSSQVQRRDLWRKIKVQENGVAIQKEFYHDYKPGSTLFLGSQNDILLEFTEEWVNIYQIRNDNTTQFLDEVKREKMANAEVPVYFSHDFKRFLTFEQDAAPSLKTKKVADDSKIKFKVFQTSSKFDSTMNSKQFERYKVLDRVYLPDFETILKNVKGQPYIYFHSKDHVCSLNADEIEQITKIAPRDELADEQDQISETYLSKEDLQVRCNLDALNFHPSQLSTLDSSTKLILKSHDVKTLSSDLKKIKYLMTLDEDLTFMNAIRVAQIENQIKCRSSRNCSLTSYAVNNCRFIQAYSYSSWRILEQICNNEVSIDHIYQAKLPELMKVVLPNGDTLVNKLIKSSNLVQLEKLISALQKLGQTTEFDLVADFYGDTPLHECIKNTYTKAAEDILKLIGKQNLSKHFALIQDILPSLIETCPMAISNYFEDRMIDCQWAMKHTIGNLKTSDSDVDFGVYSSSLACIDQAKLNEKLFEKEESTKTQAEQKRLPMQVKVFDFPKIHHFNNPIGREMITAISETDDMSLFDEKYVQALLEYQWPAVRAVIIKDLFIPYILFILAFNYYAIFQFEQEQANLEVMSTKIQGYFVKALIAILGFYFLSNEYVQFQNETSSWRYLSNVWNYIDVIPILLVLTAITLSLVGEVKDFGIVQIERYLNAVASFFIWFKFLYFFRIFRSFGHLIKTIIEVLRDMKVFLVILSFSILAFSGTFFILAQNNTGEDVHVHSYTEAIMKMFELTLGSFDTSEFGDTGFVVVYLMFSVAALFLIVVMLNLLIAIISDTFSNVQSQAEKKMYQEFAQLICENFHLLSEDEKEAYDSQGNYLFVTAIHQGS